MFRVNNLSIKIGGEWIIRELSFELEDGSLCFLSGRYGKSVLCLAFTGLLRVIYPDAEIEGGIYLDGEEVRDGFYNPRISITLENPYAQISGVKRRVINEIAFGLELNGIEAGEMMRRILKASEELSIDKLLNRDPRFLSGGETQRVAIACSYVMMPRLWILDRPFTELDRVGRLRLVRIMVEHARRGNIVIVTDDEVEMLERIATHRLVINDDGGVIFEKKGLIQSEISLNLEEESNGIEVRQFFRYDVSGDKKLVIRGLKFAYEGGCEIFNDFNFSISAGESVLITGPNGSGKTTLAKLIMGILKPNAGTIRFIDGSAEVELSALDIWEVSRYVSYAFQNPDLQIFSGSVYDEVSFSLKVRGYSRVEIERKVREVLELFKLWDFRDVHPHSLRRSQKKLLGVAIAYVMDTPILILDEPFQYQDSYTRRMIVEAIKVKLREGKMVLIITH